MAAGLVLPTKPEQLTAASSREELCQTVGKKLLKTGMETAGTTQRPRKKPTLIYVVKQARCHTSTLVLLFVPFYCLFAYFVLRPQLSSRPFCL